MARTHFLRSLVRLASQYRAARTSGLPIHAIQDRQARAVADERRAFTRRHFLGGLAAATAGLVLPGRALAAARVQPRIAIIGAGISGLNCALTLADRGVRSTVYEASPRLGGRVFSNSTGYWAENQVTEWGGELIDTDHVTVQNLASRFGLALDDLTSAQPAGAEETYYFDHGYYRYREVVEDFAAVYEAVVEDAEAADYPTTFDASTPEGRKLDRMSIREWIERRVPGGHSSNMGKLLDVAYAIEYGADTSEQSALNLVYLLSGSDERFEIFGASDERFHVRGGNQQIPLAIADHLASLGMPVRTHQRLVAIRRRPAGTFALTFQSGGNRRETTADLVVLTLPFAVLRTLDYARAGFDRLKKQAIEQLGRGRSGKLQCQFTRRLWNETGVWGVGNGSSFSDVGYQSGWEATRAQAGHHGILNHFTGGSVTGRSRTDVPFAFAGNAGVQRDALRSLHQINQLFPGLAALWNGKATSSLPHLSPFFRCSYSFWRVNQYHTIAGYEAARQGNVFFAGEHTSQDFQGFMEGAASEGERAASEILTQLGTPHAAPRPQA